MEAETKYTSTLYFDGPPPYKLGHCFPAGVPVHSRGAMTVFGGPTYVEEVQEVWTQKSARESALKVVTYRVIE